MKYILIEYANGSFGLHEVWKGKPYSRPISVGDTRAEVIADVKNMLVSAEGPSHGEPKSYAKPKISELAEEYDE